MRAYGRAGRRADLRDDDGGENDKQNAAKKARSNAQIMQNGAKTVGNDPKIRFFGCLRTFLRKGFERLRKASKPFETLAPQNASMSFIELE